MNIDFHLLVLSRISAIFVTLSVVTNAWYVQLVQAYEKGLMIAVIPFTSKVC